jgi:hypothetical protein
VPGVYLLLNTPTTIYLLALSAFLTTYGTYSHDDGRFTVLVVSDWSAAVLPR